ncbi:MAG: undecaprenyl-diphosphate phosphatase [Patescibacteria group bacterium]
MNYFDALILSVVEGVTEFLPISSTGHLILTAKFLSLTHSNFLSSFKIFIQLGAILAVVLIYAEIIWHDRALLKKIIIAFLPTAIIGLTFYSFVKKYLLGNTLVTLLALLFGGILLIIFERWYQTKPARMNIRSDGQAPKSNLSQLNFKQAFIIGIAQSLAMIPGVSRAGATIIGGLGLGLDRASAVKFSFLLAIPTVLAATALDLFKSEFVFSGQEFYLLAIGFFGAFITAFFTVKYFLKFIRSHSFVSFGIYRIILAIGFFILIGI